MLMSEINAGDATGTNVQVEANANGAGPDGQQQGGGKYRERLAAAEAERDRLVGVVEAMRRDRVTELVEGAGLKADAFFARLGDDIDTLLSDDGAVDRTKVFAAVQQTRDAFGIPDGPRAPLPDMTQGQNLDAVSVDGDDDFVRAFAPPGG